MTTPSQPPGRSGCSGTFHADLLCLSNPASALTLWLVRKLACRFTASLEHCLHYWSPTGEGRQ